MRKPQSLSNNISTEAFEEETLEVKKRLSLLLTLGALLLTSKSYSPQKTEKLQIPKHSSAAPESTTLNTKNQQASLLKNSPLNIRWTLNR